MGIISNIVDRFEAELDRRLEKSASVADSDETLEKKLKMDGYGRKGLIYDPFTDQGYSGGLFRPKGAGSSFISNMILKLISRRDPVVSTIVHIRANQVSSFHRAQANRFDVGFKVFPQDKNAEVDKEEVREIEEFFLNCGRKDERSEEDKLTFDQFGYMITHDLLVYGHCAIEKVRDMSGALYAFLPLPAETIYYANKKLMDKDIINNMITTYRDAYSTTHGKDKDTDSAYDEVESQEFEFVQVINGKVVEGFSKRELSLDRITPQTDVDLMGYAMSPLEKAVGMITAHLQIENHQKMFFTHGVASKGLLVIQGDVTPNQLKTLQAQWTNQVTGPNAAWRTPILAGIKGVQWQSLTPESRDMEYAAYQDHVLRTIHACFAIDPEETGFGYLSRGTEQRTMGESSNEFKLEASRDRGLRPLISRIEAILNEDIMPSWRSDYARKYRICFVGLDAETKIEEIERLKEEVQLHTTVDEARQQADLKPIEMGGSLILNPLLLQTLQTNMTKGMFMEKFMNIQGASQRPDLQYVPDPLWFQWMTMQMQIMQQQAQSQIQAQQGGAPAAGQQGQPEEKPQGNPSQQQPQQKSPEQMQQEQLAQEQAQQAQAMAIDQFVQANPELFKSMTQNLRKTDYSDAHVDKMRDALVDDFEKAAEKMVKEIMEAVKEDLDGRAESDESLVDDKD